MTAGDLAVPMPVWASSSEAMPGPRAPAPLIEGDAMIPFLNWFKLSASASPVRSSGVREYHASRYAQELSMARQASSPIAARAHMTLAAAHRQAMKRADLPASVSIPIGDPGGMSTPTKSTPTR